MPISLLSALAGAAATTGAPPNATTPASPPAAMVNANVLTAQDLLALQGSLAPFTVNTALAATVTKTLADEAKNAIRQFA